MKLLIDTHVFLWLMQSPDRLTPKALEVCESPDNILFFSVASAWEIEIKQQIGKLKLDMPLEKMIERCSDLQVLSVELSHTIVLRELPLLHTDPFDRLIIAQAQFEKMHLVTADRLFPQYGINLIRV